ncbi:MAG: hypothetical protein M3220_09840 [Chloroflexota bacterium]|nr:hypothetical protein [Chloroflexota bacterium]
MGKIKLYGLVLVLCLLPGCVSATPTTRMSTLYGTEAGTRLEEIKFDSIPVSEAEYPDYVATNLALVNTSLRDVTTLIRHDAGGLTGQIDAAWRAEILEALANASNNVLLIINADAPPAYDAFHKDLVVDYLITHGMLSAFYSSIRGNREQDMSDAYRLLEQFQQVVSAEVCETRHVPTAIQRILSRGLATHQPQK